MPRVARAYVLSAALLLVAAGASAQTLDYSTLLNGLTDLSGAEQTGDSAGTALSNLLNQQLLEKLKQSGATGASSAPATAAPAIAANPATEAKVCPICGANFTVPVAKRGMAWGLRLDLRMYGPVADPPAPVLCPQCGFFLYKGSYDAAELARLKPFVLSSAYKDADPRNVPYYYLALIREKGLAKTANGAYDVAHAYLEAAWQAEDRRDAELTVSYLEKALRHVRLYAATASKADPYYPTVRILPAELLRRLGRFAEAAAELEAFAGDKEFAAPFLQRIIAAERALIKVEDSAPAVSP